ncbi:malonate transporter subunit MadL [Irregularibacter muris]|jgi:malonate transporter MadL subunit|uniref:Malonate transporter subunit MadL n=1 Tax=Irregularibacter muris TaxID=1796619 RepID=A0AAE3HE23_9FIRM|nr:malonate transporter subunit MadL [Irregularibacter muris]MCR1897712.1 malonate transporter subunit MadL [Irregularibacter muris]
MEIYGLGLVALCMFIGSLLGTIIGKLIGTGGNVGGVGIAMLLLILISNFYESKGKSFNERTQKGILLLSSLYIPIVVAMSSIQNVVSAFHGGVAAFLAGAIPTIGVLFLVPLISKLGKE